MRDLDALAAGAVFQSVLDQVLEQPRELVAVARHHQRLGRRRDLDRDVAIARQRLQAVGDLAHDRDEIDRRVGPLMRAQLDARQRKQIVDQPRHAPGLRLHDAEEAFARRRIVARRALQRFDEARERRKRRAQLMADVGDEVGAHLLDPPDRGEIMDGDDHDAGAGPAAGQRDRRNERLGEARRRQPRRKLDALRLAGENGRSGSHRPARACEARSRPARRGAVPARCAIASVLKASTRPS